MQVLESANNERPPQQTDYSKAQRGRNKRGLLRPLLTRPRLGSCRRERRRLGGIKGRVRPRTESRGTRRLNFFSSLLFFFFWFFGFLVSNFWYCTRNWQVLAFLSFPLCLRGFCSLCLGSPDPTFLFYVGESHCYELMKYPDYSGRGSKCIIIT